MGALFFDLKLGDEEIVLLHIDSVSIIEPVEDATVTETDAKHEMTVRKFCVSLKTEAENMKKVVMGRIEGRFLGLDGIIIGPQISRAIKCEDHGRRGPSSIGLSYIPWLPEWPFHYAFLTWFSTMTAVNQLTNHTTAPSAISFLYALRLHLLRVLAFFLAWHLYSSHLD